MPRIQTHINAKVGPLSHVTRMRGGGKTREFPPKSFISSDRARGSGCSFTDPAGFDTPTFMYLIYRELDVWTNLVVISDVLLNLQFCSFSLVRSGHEDKLHYYYHSLRYSTYMFGRISSRVQTKCPNIYVRVSKGNVRVVKKRVCVSCYSHVLQQNCLDFHP